MPSSGIKLGHIDCYKYCSRARHRDVCLSLRLAQHSIHDEVMELCHLESDINGYSQKWLTFELGNGNVMWRLHFYWR